MSHTTVADAHIHLFRDGFHGDAAPGSDVRRYERISQTNGIEAALAIGYEGEAQYSGNSDYLLSLAKTRDWLHATKFVDMHSRPVAAEFTRARDRGFAGFSFYLDAHTAGFEGWSRDDLKALGSPGSIISVNAEPVALSRAREALAVLDRATVLISHLGLPGPLEDRNAVDVLAPVLELAAHSHVLVKVSGLYAIDKAYPHDGAELYLRVLLDQLGAEKLVWGSDYPVSLDFMTEQDAFATPDWLRQAVTAEDWRKISFENLNEALVGSRSRSA